MLTLEQIKNVTFSKARGGYSTAEVDEFIDRCVDTLASVIDERNTANKKLEVLAEKLKEYRSEEDSIRSALVNAQRLGDTIVREANQKAALTQEDAAIKAEKIVKEAEVKAEGILAGIAEEARKQEAELQRLKQEVALFKDRMLSIYREHLSLLQLLPEEEPKEEPAEEPAEEASAESTSPLAAEEAAEVAVTAEECAPSTEDTEESVSSEDAVEEPTAVEEEQIPAVTSLEEIAEADVSEEAPKSRFSGLKFGDDYDIAEEEDQRRGFFRRKKQQ